PESRTVPPGVNGGSPGGATGRSLPSGAGSGQNILFGDGSVRAKIAPSLGQTGTANNLQNVNIQSIQAGGNGVFTKELDERGATVRSRQERSGRVVPGLNRPLSPVGGNLQGRVDSGVKVEPVSNSAGSGLTNVNANVNAGSVNGNVGNVNLPL